MEHLKAGHLPGLSFEVGDGRCLAVEGPSGSGKSLLLRAIADLDVSQGHIFLDGQERLEMPATAWRGLVRYVASEPAWWSDTPRGSLCQTKDELRRAARLMTALGLEEAAIDQPVATLSTGERQRLALVRALTSEPKVLLLDEPTASLDIRSSALVEELIKYQLLAGRIVLLASHDPRLIDRLAHERLILEASRSGGIRSNEETSP